MEVDTYLRPLDDNNFQASSLAGYREVSASCWMLSVLVFRVGLYDYVVIVTRARKRAG